MSYSRDFAPGSKVCCAKPVIGTIALAHPARCRTTPTTGAYGRSTLTATSASGTRAVPMQAVSRRSSTKQQHSAGRASPTCTCATTGTIRLPLGRRRRRSPSGVRFQVRRAISSKSSRTPGSAIGVPNVRTLACLHRDDRVGPDRQPAHLAAAVSRQVSAADGSAARHRESYCVRVRAKSDTDSNRAEVYGDFTYLNGPDQVAFTFAGYPCTAGCTRAYLSGSDYRGSQTGKTAMPYFTWNGVNAGSWFVLVAKDPEFHNIVDYGWTQVRAYAPRFGDDPITYPDETTSYYWAVLPPPGTTAPAAGRPALRLAGEVRQGVGPAAARSRPPRARAVRPTPGLRVDWGRRRPALQPAGLARRRLRHAAGQCHDRVDHIHGQRELSGGRALYWRVRAEDEEGFGLTWSETRVFRYKLAARTPPAVSAPGTSSRRGGGGRFGVLDIRHACRPARRLAGGLPRDPRIRPDSYEDDRHRRLPLACAGELPQGRSGSVPGPWSVTRPFTRTSASRWCSDGRRRAQRPLRLAAEDGRTGVSRPGLGAARLRPRLRPGDRGRDHVAPDSGGASRPRKLALALLARGRGGRGSQPERIHQAEAIPRRLADVDRVGGACPRPPASLFRKGRGNGPTRR